MSMTLFQDNMQQHMLVDHVILAVRKLLEQQKDVIEMSELERANYFSENTNKSTETLRNAINSASHKQHADFHDLEKFYEAIANKS